MLSSNPLHHRTNTLQTRQARTMEEVWKDINLASLHDHSSADHDFCATPRISSHHPHQQNPNFILQDFLARPFSKDPLPTTIGIPCTTPVYRSPARPPPPPAIALSLNPCPPGFNPRRGGSHLQAQQPNISNISSLNSNTFMGSLEKTRIPESDPIYTVDRRHKRMIKNRESAARSRARKQAYTTELELEVSQLKEEIARLKIQQKPCICTAAAAQIPKRKHSLQRTVTAPF